MDFTATQRYDIPRPSQRDVDALANSALFRPDWYRARYPDTALSGLDAATHYLLIGALLLRDPSPDFSTACYLADNPDVARARINPLLHFIRSGAAEGRRLRSAAERRDSDSLIQPVGPEPWLDQLRRGPFLDAMRAEHRAAPRPVTDRQLALARQALAGQTPRISVVMPARNRAAAVADALTNVFQQSLQPAEVILVDDGSEDRTLDIVRRDFAAPIAQGVLRIIAAPHEGFSAARNRGLAAATGDLIAYLGGDNRWMPDYLLCMAAAFAECDGLSAAYCGLSVKDPESGVSELRGLPWDRQSLITVNDIDLNVFMHRRALYDQYGGFDTQLELLADWDLITRYTRLYEPVYLPLIGARSRLQHPGLNDIFPLARSESAISARNRAERLRRGLDRLKLAYVLWDWPALSQTFVLAEIRWLVAQGHDVNVYYKIAPDRAAALDFTVDAYQVENPAELAKLLQDHGRNQIHAHFAYPCTTQLAWPAARLTGIPFTFFAHAVDIFHESNIPRNRIAEIAADPLCQRLFVHGDYHRRFLERLNVPAAKIGYNFQAVDLDGFDMDTPLRPLPQGRVLRGMFIGRFVEKKGLPVLLDAAARLGPEAVQFDVYGYGRDEDAIHAQAAQLGLQNVKFHGPLDDREGVVAAMRRADFLVVPSIVAATGDTEGFPTVILEAMAMGLPVVTSDVSSIPDFLSDGFTAILTRAGDPASLADGVTRLAAMAPARLTTMLTRARAFLRQRIGTWLTMRTYLDTWLDARIEIVLVTYDTAGYRDIDQTRDIIRRIRQHTTTPYTLSVIDNGSDPDFLAMLRAQAAGMPNMRLIELTRNRYCGGATNIALAASDAVYAIYVCSKEGFVLHHGWERALLNQMRDQPGADLGGYLCHMPKYTLGSELPLHPAFDQFRNRPFAAANPDRPFRHVQGGVYILRRAAAPDAARAFSSRLPQGNTDVELSYFMESSGRSLLPLGAVASLTVKTQPMLSAVLDEATAIAHPLTQETAAGLSARLETPGATHCNICASWDQIDGDGTCRGCGSDGTARKLYQRLAHDWRGHRGGKALLIGDNGSLARVLATPYQLQTDENAGPFALIASQTELDPDRAQRLAGRLAPGGLLIWPAADADWIAALPGSLGLRGDTSDRCSRLLLSDWRPLHEIENRAAASA